MIINDNFIGIKIHELKDHWLLQKKATGDLKTVANIEANRCQHYEKCSEKPFYYLPEIRIQLWFRHRFHKAYFFCSEYLPLLKFDLWQILETLHLLQNKATSESWKSLETSNLKLRDPIIDEKSFWYDLRSKWLVLLQNEVLTKWTEWCGSFSKTRDFNDIEEILLELTKILSDSSVRVNRNYWIPTLNDYENDPKLFQNMLKVEIFEYIVENRFPKYWRKKQVDSKAEKIIEYLYKDYGHNNTNLHWIDFDTK